MTRTGHWPVSRWATPPRPAPADPPGATAPAASATKGDLLHALIQRLADLDADAEGEPRRPVPRLPSDPALLDQRRVVAADVARATPDPAARERAAAEITALAARL